MDDGEPQLKRQKTADMSGAADDVQVDESLESRCVAATCERPNWWASVRV